MLEFELFCVIVIWLTCMCLQMHCSQRCSKLGFFLRHCSCFLEWNSYFGWCECDSVFIVLNWVFLLKHCSWLLAWHTHSSWRNTSWDDSCWGLQMVYRDVTCLTLCGVRCSFSVRTSKSPLGVSIFLNANTSTTTVQIAKDSISDHENYFFEKSNF